MIISKKESKIKILTNTISEDIIRVMSFNIHIDCKEDSGYCCWSKRKEYVASMIRFHHMDIIGLQEPTIEQLKDLKELAPEYAQHSSRLEKIKKYQTDAILYLEERFELLDASYFFLSPTPEKCTKGWKSKFVRGVTWAKFKDKYTDQIFYFFNTHFDYHSSLARNNSAKLLKQKVKEICKNDPFIITGDFNIFPKLGGKTTYKLLTEDNFFLDAQHKSLYPHHGPTGSWSGFKEAGQPGIKPDYIFVDKKISVKSHGILADTFDGKFPSDHMPVVSEIIIY
jgi:endonuclease/exonuclease/phosphatase family metal-dependent hydrolase